MTRVFVADDHPIMLSGIEAILRQSDFDVVGVAVDGDAALRGIHQTDPDIALLDLRLPGMTGIEILRALRADGDARRVVLLTAEISDRDLIEAIELSVSGVLLKDGAQNLLLRCLEDVAAGTRWIEKSLMSRALDASMKAKASPGGGLSALTVREREIADLVTRGLRNRAIAEALGISEGTVKVQLYRVYEKLGVSNRTELAIYCRDHAG